MTTTSPAPIYRHATQLGWLFAQANEHDMPAPGDVHIHNEDWAHTSSINLNFDSLADLTAWAIWADVSIGDTLGVDDEFLGYGFDAAINEVRLVCRYWTKDREAAA